MRNNKRYKEINITSEEIFNYKNNKKKYTKRKSENKFVKALYSAFMMFAGAGVIAVSLLTSSVSNVSLFARNASSLTFYVNFNEKDAEIEYDLTDKSNKTYYPDEEFGDEIVEESEKPDYIHFTGLEPDTEYTFTVRDKTNDNKTLYTGSFLTGKKDVDISCETWFESTGLKGYIYNSGIDGFYSVIIEDTSGKKVFTKDYDGKTDIKYDELNGQYFEIPGYKLKDNKYNLYIKYKNEKVYQQTLIKTGVPDKYIEVKSDIKDVNLVIDYYYHGYSDLALEVKDKNNKTIDKRSLVDNSGKLNVPNIKDDEYYLTVKDKNGEVYFGKVQSQPDIEIIENRLENGTLYLKYIIHNYTGTHSLSILNSQGVEEKHFEFDKNEIEKEFYNLSDTEYSIVITTSKSSQVTEKVTNVTKPTLDYSYDFKYGVLSLKYKPDHLETNDKLKVAVYEEDGKQVYSDVVDYISNDAYLNNANVNVGPFEKSLVLKNLFGKVYFFTIEQNGKELFKEQLYQNNPELKPICDYSVINGKIKASFKIDKLGENSLTGILIDSKGNILGNYDIKSEFTIEKSNVDSNEVYSFCIVLSDEELFKIDFVSYEDEIDIPDIILLKDTFTLPTFTSLCKQITYKIEHNGYVSVEENILKNNNQNQNFELVLNAYSNYVEKEITVYSYPKVQNRLVSENVVTYTIKNHPLESEFEYYINGNSVIPEISENNGQSTFAFGNLQSGSMYKFVIKFKGTTLYEDEFKTPDEEDVKVNYFDYEFQNGDLSATVTIENLDGEYFIEICDENETVVYSKVYTSPECAIYVNGLNGNEYYLKVMYSGNEIFRSTLENTLNVEVSTQYSFENGELNLYYALSDNSSEYSLLIVDKNGNTVYSIESQTLENSISLELEEDEYDLLIYIRDNRIYKETLVQVYDPVIELTYDFEDGNLDIEYSIDYFKNNYTIRITDAGVDVYVITRTTKNDVISLNSLSEGTYVITFEVDGDIVYSENLEQIFNASVDSLEYTFKDGELDLSYLLKNVSAGHTIYITDSANEEVYASVFTDSKGNILLSELPEGDLNFSVVAEGKTIYSIKLVQVYTPSIEDFDYTFANGELHITFTVKHHDPTLNVRILDQSDFEWYSSTPTSGGNTINLTDLTDVSLVNVLFEYDNAVIMMASLVPEEPETKVTLNGKLEYGTLSFDYTISNPPDIYHIFVLDDNLQVVYSEEDVIGTEGSITIIELYLSNYTIQFIANETIIQSFEIEDSSQKLEIDQEYILVNGDLDLTVYIDDLPDENSLKAYINTLSGESIYSCDVSSEFSIELSQLDKASSYYLVINKGSDVIYNYELEYSIDSIELPDIIFLGFEGLELPEQTVYGYDIEYNVNLPDFAEVSDFYLHWIEQGSTCSFMLTCSSDSVFKEIYVYPGLEVSEFYTSPKEIAYYFINHELFDSFTYYINGEISYPYVGTYSGADFTLVDFEELEPGTEYEVKIMYGENVVFEDTQTTPSYPQYQFTNVNITYDSISFTLTVGDNPNEYELWVYGDDIGSTETDDESVYLFEELERNTTYTFYVSCNDDVIGYQTFTTLDYPDLVVEITSEQAYTYSYMMKFTMQNDFDREIEYYINGEQVQADIEREPTSGFEVYTILKRFDSDVDSISVEFKETIVVGGKETEITLYSHQLEIQ